MVMLTLSLVSALNARAMSMSSRCIVCIVAPMPPPPPPPPTVADVIKLDTHDKTREFAEYLATYVDDDDDDSA